ncbi:MAG: thermonuclease family protein [Cyanobacteria bacterium J06623_7]
MNIRNIILCCCLLFLLSCSSSLENKNRYAATVTRVLSGQTVEVRLTGKPDTIRVRVTGIDAPDWRQTPWGDTAKEKLKELVMNQTIAIETDNTDNLVQDHHNRIRGHLWQGDILVSQELLKSGCVLMNDRTPHSYSMLLRSAQEYARLMGYGIWNPQQPMRYTPSQFRSLNPQ